MEIREKLYSREYLKNLMDARQDAVDFSRRLRAIGCISPQEETLFTKVLEILDAEIWGVSFILDLEEELLKKE